MPLVVQGIIPVYSNMMMCVSDVKRQRQYFLVKKHAGIVTSLCTILSTETEKGASHSVEQDNTVLIRSEVGSGR